MNRGVMNRRLGGWLKARLPDVGLEQVEDRRGRRGRRWALSTLLRTVLVGLIAGRKSLAEVEELTLDLTRPMRKLLGIPRRVADTTLRDVLVMLRPDELRRRLHVVIKAALRRKALAPVAFPFGVVALDGKGTSLPCWEHPYVQRQADEERARAIGVLRTVTCALVSAPGKPCIDAVPIPAETNEVGHLRHVVDELLHAYRGTSLFRLFTYDAGGCSEENAAYIVERGYEYLFAVKGTQPQLLEAVTHALAGAPRLARTEDVLSDKSTVTRRLHLVSPQLLPIRWGKHAKTFLCVVSTKRDSAGALVFEETRYYVSSLGSDLLSHDAWLALVRHHWGVENNCHHTFDAVFREDDHPWIEMAPSGTLAVLLLRRIAYTLLTLFRSRTQRSEHARVVPWRRLLRSLHLALVSATTEQLDGLRRREVAAFR